MRDTDESLSITLSRQLLDGGVQKVTQFNVKPEQWFKKKKGDIMAQLFFYETAVKTNSDSGSYTEKKKRG